MAYDPKRTYRTGVRLTEPEVLSAEAGNGYILVEPTYHWDHIDLGHTVIEAHQFGVERRAPYTATVHSVGKPMSKGYGYDPSGDIQKGDKVWMKNYTSFFAMGQTNVGSQKNMALWSEGKFLMAVRHQEIVARERDGDFAPLNGYVFFDGIIQNMTGKTTSWTGSLIHDIGWAKTGENVIVRVKPHELEYTEVRTKDLWYCSPQNVIGVWR